MPGDCVRRENNRRFRVSCERPRVRAAGGLGIEQTGSLFGFSKAITETERRRLVGWFPGGGTKLGGVQDQGLGMGFKEVGQADSLDE